MEGGPAHLPDRGRQAREPLAAEGHHARVMDSLCEQALSAEYAIQNDAELERRSIRFRRDQKEIARMKLGRGASTSTSSRRSRRSTWPRGNEGT